MEASGDGLGSDERRRLRAALRRAVRCWVVYASLRRKTLAHDLGVAILAREDLEDVTVGPRGVQAIDAIFGTPGWDRRKGETEDTREGIEGTQRFHGGGRRSLPIK